MQQAHTSHTLHVSSPPSPAPSLLRFVEFFCLSFPRAGITHSCCTTEFASRQAADGPYYFLLHELGLYKPVTVEFARCNVASSVFVCVCVRARARARACVCAS